MSHNQDQYTAQADKSAQVTPQEKIDGLKEILTATKFGMMTTKCPDGNLHSRCMALASHESLHFFFLANNASHKFEELESDAHVNVSFLDPSSTNWVSVTGEAKLTQNKNKINELWNPMTKAWFGDLGDGVHKGNQDDPRVSVIEVIPSEIRYWKANKGRIAQTLDIAASAITGNVASPGELRTITKDEIRIVEGLNTA